VERIDNSDIHEAKSMFSITCQLICPFLKKLQRTPEKPCLNDVSDVGTWRRAALIVSVFLVVLTLIPLWDELAEDLGVGLVTLF
jgi:hypothetical protein